MSFIYLHPISLQGLPGAVGLDGAEGDVGLAGPPGPPGTNVSVSCLCCKDIPYKSSFKGLISPFLIS